MYMSTDTCLSYLEDSSMLMLSISLEALCFQEMLKRYIIFVASTVAVHITGLKNLSNSSDTKALREATTKIQRYFSS